jgi:putative transposase
VCILSLNWTEKELQNLAVQLWQQDNHSIELFDPKILRQQPDYIHDNPVVAGIVERAEEYLYSSARNYYCGSQGLIDVILLAR